MLAVEVGRTPICKRTILEHNSSIAASCTEIVLIAFFPLDKARVSFNREYAHLPTIELISNSRTRARKSWHRNEHIQLDKFPNERVLRKV